LGVELLPVAVDGPGLARLHMEDDVVVQGDGLHDHSEIVVAVLPAAQNVERQIQFGKGALCENFHYLIFLPSR
jgi:hypothetical protein